MIFCVRNESGSAWQNVLIREIQFTSAIDLLKAVTVVILGFLMRRKKMMYFIRPRNYPTWQGIAGHFTITAGKLGEKPTCAHLLRQKTYKTYWVELVSVDFEVALHGTCFCRECVKHNMQHRENSLYPDYTDWSLEFSGTSTCPPIRNNHSYAWNSCKQSTGKVKLISTLYRLKLFTLILISFSTAKISYLELDVILSSGDVFYLTSVGSLKNIYIY